MARIKVAYILTHPIQYFSPLLKKLAEVEDIKLKVIYGSRAGAAPFQDPHFQTSVSWDTRLLDGYDHVFLSESAEMKRGFFGFKAHDVSRHLSKDQAEVAIIHGWGNLFYLASTLIALRRGIAVLYRTEANREYERRSFDPQVKLGRLRKHLKPFILKPLLRRIHGFLAIGALNRSFYLDLGVEEKKIFMAPYSVDDALFKPVRLSPEEKEEAERKLGMEPGCFRVLFSGKLVSRKRPGDVLEAVSRLPSSANAEAVFVGDGELRPSLERTAQRKGLKACFLGFRNQRELPLIYSLCHVLALPSECEPWGLVVNEAMSVGLPALVSEGVGCREDLVVPGESGYVFPVGGVEELARRIQELIENHALYEKLKTGARRAAGKFSLDRTLEGYLEAIRFAAGLKN